MSFVKKPVICSVPEFDGIKQQFSPLVLFFVGKSVILVKIWIVHTHQVSVSLWARGRLRIPTLCKVTRLFPTHTGLLSGSDMRHSKPKHIVAAVTISSDEEEGRVCQTVQLWDNGDNISLGPWVTVGTVTLQSHLGHGAWARNKKSTLCLNSIPPPFYTHTAYTFMPERKNEYLLVCFHYPPIISLLVLATERDRANVLRDQTMMSPRPLIWVLTESPISIFPALGKKDRKCEHLELIIFASCRNAFTELWFRVMPV